MNDPGSKNQTLQPSPFICNAFLTPTKQTYVAARHEKKQKKDNTIIAKP